ncbi:MAG TPA: RNA polymerase sigma factor [Candidatus Limnocylindrales bacterium]
MQDERGRRDLVERARLGDEDAFARLVTAHLDAAWRFVRAVGGDRVDVDDVVQEAFLMAWRDLPSLREPGAFEPWLRAVLLHATRNEIRRRGRVRLIPIAMPSDDQEGHRGTVTEMGRLGSPDPGASIANRDAVGRAFARLSIDERTVLALHHLEGWPVERIAAAIGRPSGTVKSRMHTARRSLRAALAAEDR